MKRCFLMGVALCAAVAKIPRNWKVSTNAAAGSVTLASGGLALAVR